jgi:hypothetical protein
MTTVQKKKQGGKMIMSACPDPVNLDGISCKVLEALSVPIFMPIFGLGNAGDQVVEPSVCD